MVTGIVAIYCSLISKIATRMQGASTLGKPHIDVEMKVLVGDLFCMQEAGYKVKQIVGQFKIINA